MKYPKTKAQSRTILAVVMIQIPLKSINQSSKDQITIHAFH